LFVFLCKSKQQGPIVDPGYSQSGRSDPGKSDNAVTQNESSET
jgi:hypothetical protein